MSLALKRPPASQRTSLLGIVIAAHVGVAALIMAAKVVAPVLQENPLFVDFITPDSPKPPEAKPLPVKPQTKPQPTPKTPTPPLETTTSSQPAPAAPVAPPPDPKPAPVVAAAPAEPAVSQPRFDADYLRNPAPAYPPLSRRMGEEGKVILRVQVSPQGTADTVEIKTSSGSTRLDEAALKTVRNWKFIPAKKGDTPVQSWVLVPIIFKLEQ